MPAVSSRHMFDVRRITRHMFDVSRITRHMFDVSRVTPTQPAPLLQGRGEMPHGMFAGNGLTLYTSIFNDVKFVKYIIKDYCHNFCRCILKQTPYNIRIRLYRLGCYTSRHNAEGPREALTDTHPLQMYMHNTLYTFSVERKRQ